MREGKPFESDEIAHRLLLGDQKLEEPIKPHSKQQIRPK